MKYICTCCQVEYDDWIAHVLSEEHINWINYVKDKVKERLLLVDKFKKDSNQMGEK